MFICSNNLKSVLSTGPLLNQKNFKSEIRFEIGHEILNMYTCCPHGDHHEFHNFRQSCMNLKMYTPSETAVTCPRVVEIRACIRLLRTPQHNFHNFLNCCRNLRMIPYRDFRNCSMTWKFAVVVLDEVPGGRGFGENIFFFLCTLFSARLRPKMIYR